MLSSRPVDFNNGGVFFPTKTPARSIKARLENQSVGGPTMSAKGGKMASGMPKTPFHAGSSQKTILYTISRPLGDKTPAANRLNPILFRTPAGGKAGGQANKLSKLVLETNNVEEGDEQDGNTPPSSQRPSSLRKNIKQPKQLKLNGMMGSLEAFQTPMNKGNHWDIEDDEMVGLEGQGLMQEAILEDAVEDGDSSDGEVEFGHPNNLDLPYQPPFDFELPDFEALGKRVRSLAFGSLIHDSETPVFADPQIMNHDLTWSGIEIELDPLQSDDPFEEARNEGKPMVIKPTAAPLKGRVPLSKASSVKHTTSLKITRQRPTSSLARLPSQPTTRPPAGLTTRVALPNSRPAHSGYTTTASSKAVTSKGATSTNIITSRKVISKPAIPSSTTTVRPIARSTSTTIAGTTQPVVRQNLASLRRAQTAMSVRDARSGGVSRVASTVKVGSGLAKMVKPGPAKTNQGDRDGLGGLKLDFEGDGMEDDFLFTIK